MKSFILAVLLVTAAALYGQSVVNQGRDILNKSDRRFYPQEGTCDMRFKYSSADGQLLENDVQAYKKGTANQTVVWVSPEVQKNSVGLRAGDTIYYKQLKASRPMIMSYQALFMDSGFSWGDVISSDIASDYKADKIDSVKESGKDCYLLTLKPIKENMYARIDVWVDKENFNTYKRLYYTASGDKLKLAVYTGIKEEDGKVVSFHVEIDDYFQETKSSADVTKIKAETLPKFIFDPQNIGRIHVR